jgi:hypothetical protein
MFCFTLMANFVTRPWQGRILWAFGAISCSLSVCLPTLPAIATVTPVRHL